jgi:hypothetical protein
MGIPVTILINRKMAPQMSADAPNKMAHVVSRRVRSSDASAAAPLSDPAMHRSTYIAETALSRAAIVQHMAASARQTERASRLGGHEHRYCVGKINDQRDDDAGLAEETILALPGITTVAAAPWRTS